MAFDETPESNALLSDQIRNIIHHINIDDALSAINETDILIKTLPKEFKQKHDLNKITNLCRKFLQKPEYNRLLRLNQKIKLETDTAIEYYDQDIGQDQRLYYHEQLEKDLLESYNEIRKLLAILIQEKLTENINL